MSSTHPPSLTTNPLRDPDGLPDDVKTRRAFTLVLLTAVLPGSAQVVAGRRDLGRRGLAAVIIGALLVVLAAVLYFMNRSWLFAIFTQAIAVWVLAAAALVLGVGWLILHIDALKLALRPGLSPSSKSSVLIASVLATLLTVGPTLYGANLLRVQAQTLSSIFGWGSVEKPTDGRYNILLIGGDAGEGRTGLRNDTNIVVSIDAKTGQAVQIGIPRNLASARFAQGSPLAKRFESKGFNRDGDNKFNAIYAYGTEHGSEFKGVKDPGARAVMDASSWVTGLEIHYYVLIDLAGFEGLINALGGVDITVNKRVPKAGILDKKVPGYINEGPQHLDGADALWFARSRYNSSDYERMIRQRCVADAMVKQLEPQVVLQRFQQIAEASEGLVSTNIPQQALGDFVDLALETKSQPITSVQLTPPEINTSKPNFNKARAMVAGAIAATNAPEPDTKPNNPVVPAPSSPKEGDPPPPPPDRSAPICQT